MTACKRAACRLTVQPDLPVPGRRALPLLVLVSGSFLLISARRLNADGNEAIGPPPPGCEFAQGNIILAGGVGLERAQPSNLMLDIPQDVTIEQILLYWGLRSDQGDDTIIIRPFNTSACVNGTLMGRSPSFPLPEKAPFVFLADIIVLAPL